MNKRARRKKQIARRVTAILLSLAMVFSVIYINNRNDEANAASTTMYPEIDEYEETQFLSGKDFKTSGQEYKIVNPVEKVKFLLPAVTSDSADEYYGWYEYDNVPAQDTTSPWTVSGGQPVTHLSGLSESGCTTKAVLCLIHNGAEEVPQSGSDPGSPQVDATVTELSSVELVKQELVNISTVTVDDEKQTVTVSDEDPIYSVGSTSTDPLKLKYAQVSYAYEKNSSLADVKSKDQAGSITGWGSLSAMGTALNADGDSADGFYHIYTKVVINKNGTEEIIDWKTLDYERNFCFNFSEMSISAGSVKGSYDPGSKTFTIGGVGPMDPVVIAFTTDDAINSIVAKKGSDTITGSGNSVTIPGDKNNDGLQNVEYTIEVSASDKVKESFTAVISYKSTKPTIQSVGLKSGDTVISRTDTTGRYLVNVDDTKDNKVVKVTAAVNTTEGTSITAKLLKGSDQVGDAQTVNANYGTFEFPVTLTTAGEYEYKVSAESGNVEADPAGSVKLFYDNSKPRCDKVQITQTFSGGDRTQTEADGTFATKLSAAKDFTLTVTATDEANTPNESQIKSVTVNMWGPHVATSVDGNDYKFTFPANDAYKYQTNGLPFEIVIEDNAGNVTTKTVTVFFAKDEIKVNSDIKDENAKTKQVTGNGNFDIEYTFDADAPLESAQLTLKQTIGTESSDVTVDITKAQLDQTKTQDAAGVYHYTYTYNVKLDKTAKLEKITMTATNHNDAVGKNEIDVINIDMTDPDVSYTFDPNDLARISSGGWFRNLIINVTYTDSDPSGGFHNDPDGSKTFPLQTGVIVSSNQFDGSTGKGSAVLTVDASNDTSGTEVEFHLMDAMGNLYKFPKTTVYVDAMPPKITSIRVNGQDTVTSSVKGDPTVSFATWDNLGVVDVKASISRKNGATVDITSFVDKSKMELKATALSTLLGGSPEDGDYTVTVTIADLPVESVTTPYGGYETVTQSFNFTLDNTPPTLSAKLESPEIIKNGMYTNEKEVVVLLHVEEPHLDLTTLKVTDNAIEQKVSWKDSAGGVKDARLVVKGQAVHTIKLEARDDAPNTNAVVVPQFVIDTTNPSIATTLGDAPYYEKSYSYLRKTANIGVTVSDNNKDAVHGLSITEELMPHDGSKSTTTIRKDQKDGTYKYSSDGDYVITYAAVDLAGNKTTRKIRFTVDKTVPVNNIIIRKPENAAKYDKYHTTYENEETGASYTYAQYYNHDVVMDITAEDYNMKKILATDSASDTPILEIDNYDSQESGSYSIPYTASSEGMHTIAVTTWDRSGNVSTVKNVSFVIDKTKPVLNTTLNASSFVSGGETRYLNTNGTVAVTVSDANKDKEDLTRTLKVTPPGGSASTTVSKVNEGSQDFTSEADYDVSFVAVDLAGNESATHETTFRVDKTAPELRISGASDGGASTQAVNIVYNVHEAFYSDMTKAIVRVYRKLDGSGESLIRTVDFKATGQDSSMTENFSEDGEYRFEFEAEDRTGNTANTSYSFMLDATAPTIVLNGVKNYDKTKEDVEVGILVTENFYTTNTLNIDGTRIDIDGKKNAVKVEPFNANRSRELNIVQIFKEDGIYDLNINSKDRAGNEAKQSVHFTIDKTAPEIGDLSKYDGKKLNKFVWDIDEQKLVRDLTVCDVTIYLDGTVYDGMANLTDGSHVLRVTATDELGNSSSKEVTFQLDQIAPNIIVTGIEDKQRIEEPVNISVSLQIDTDILDSVTLNDSPVTLDGNTANFKVDSAGDYKLVVKAHDEAENQAELEWTFTYGSKFNWWWIVAIGGGVLLLLIILLIIRRKSWSKK